MYGIYMGYMTFSVRELQAKLGAALRAVQAGERVLVLSRGRPVAVLSAADASIPDESAVERRLRGMARTGRIRLGNGRPFASFDPVASDGGSTQVIKDLR